MALEFTSIGNVTGSLFSGSFLSDQDTSLFLTSQSVDLFYGYSARDVTELTVYDTSNNFISWSLLNQSKVFKPITLTYVDALNNAQSYTYNELQSEFIIFRSKQILLDPVSDLAAAGITEGNFKLSYIFTREMAGDPKDRLVINEISPSRTEIKLLPKGAATIPYSAFCIKKFPISDIASVLLAITQNCPYDNIYKIISVLPQYSDGLLFLQSIFFLPDDGSVVSFLRTLYEDFIKYTTLSQAQIESGIDPTRIYRIQGIKSYFNNYLLQGYNVIADFNDIETQFNNFVNIRVAQAFSPFKNQLQSDAHYVAARQFVVDFFTVFFYGAAVHPIQRIHQTKYFSHFKNVLNFGNGEFFPILDHSFLDERQSPADPLTLIIKLGSELPIDITEKQECWVSNFGMTPWVFTAFLQNPVQFPTLKIGPPNFGTPAQFINKQNVNKMYSSKDLSLQDDTENSIFVNKQLSLLSTDFSDFKHFVVFSSATARVNVFKNKAISYYTLSGSLSAVNTAYFNSLSSSTPYAYYASEKTTLQGQINELVQSFDAYESYLFNNGKYVYSPASSSFINRLFVEGNDDSASVYDKYNRDSLISNTPDFVRDNSNNQDYLTFLAMVGHHFDNIYTYISALPLERSVRNQVSSSLPTSTLKELLYSFGWQVDDIINGLDIDDVYLNSLNGPTYNVLSAQDRLRMIWNRILVTLPGIFKHKGTEACVQFLMACYGLPTSLLSIREYGGTDFALDTAPTYEIDEKTYMAVFSGVNDRIEGPFPQDTQTIEFKFAVESSSLYHDWQRYSLFTLYPYSQSAPSNAAWSVDIYKVPGEFAGKVALQMKSGSTGTAITSSVLPIFNGEIFSVMVRRNDVDPMFEFSLDPDAVPLQYDLHVQRNEGGRAIFQSTSSAIFSVQDNRTFSQYGRFWFSDGHYVGTLDKLGLWNIALDDADFEEHVNDLNSYGFSGSVSYADLYVKLGWDYPQNLHTGSPSILWVDNRSVYYFIPNYRTSLWASSSIVTSSYTAAQQIITNRWRSEYPSGSVDILAFNIPNVINPNWSASFDGCNYISNSVYPWSFREFTYQQNLDGSKYGPNKFKNKKIRKVDYEIDARFDSDDRSTFDANVTITGESNQIGFFIDPQDSKNKDIIRYVGKTGIMDLIADPRNLYSDKYYDLVNKNKEYNAFGNKRTLFNEMLTVFKFYFDKSIFEAIKNVVPARSNIFTGVVIEPTILERPKYQNKPINAGISASYQVPAAITHIYNFSSTVLWANFSTNSFVGYNQTIDLSYINIPDRQYPSNLNTFGYINDAPDRIQRSFYPDFEDFPREWDLVGAPAGWPITGIDGTVSYDLNTTGRLIIGDTSYYAPIIGSADPKQTGYNTGSHQILYYLIKVWEKYNYFAKSGSWVRNENPLENFYQSASYFLYRYAIVSEAWYKRYAYANTQTSTTDPSYELGYNHFAGTFRNSPNLKVSNTINNLGPTFPLNPFDFTYQLRPDVKYFELVGGRPRNHYINKMEKFSKTKYPSYGNGIYVKGRNNINTTVNTSGINDGTYPVISSNTSNVNVVNTGNVIQFVPSNNAGTVIPGGHATTNSSTSTGGTNVTSRNPTAKPKPKPVSRQKSSLFGRSNVTGSRKTRG